MVLQDEEDRITIHGENLSNIEFKMADELEVLHNFRKIAIDLKALENVYTECLMQIPDRLFTEDQIEECLGKDFKKFVLDVRFEILKTLSQADQRIRGFFIDGCYLTAGENE